MDKPYNIYVKAFFSRFNAFNLSKDRLAKVLEAYKKGETKISISGVTYGMDRVSEFRIFESDYPELTRDQFFEKAQERMVLSWYEGSKPIVDANGLAVFGREVTDVILGDVGQGIDSDKMVGVHGNFVSMERMEELKIIKHEEFDLTKLIRLCEELNFNFNHGNFLSVAMNARAILDHVPPIFGFRTFDDVQGQYSGGRSFKKNMEHLNKSMRSIADSYLHMPIRKKESLPNKEQVDFRADMDVLLCEIVRLLK